MKEETRIIFKDTATTRRLCLAGMEGVVDRVDGDTLRVYVIDDLLGPAGPFVVTEADVEEQEPMDEEV